jgi:hypothetical protein
VAGQAAPAAASPLAELLITRYDPLAMIRIASGEQLRIARKVAFDLAGFGSFCALHAALLPDTPGSPGCGRLSPTGASTRC